jgi:hypothetical protein
MTKVLWAGIKREENLDKKRPHDNDQPHLAALTESSCPFVCDRGQRRKMDGKNKDCLQLSSSKLINKNPNDYLVQD